MNAMHIGEFRAQILDQVRALTAGGMTVLDATAELQLVDRSTINRWAHAVAGRPRQEWPEILLSKRLKTTVFNHRARIWKALHILRPCTYADLETTTETSPRNLRNYVTALWRAGYLRRNARRGHSVVWWQIVRDTGPLAPRVLSDGRVYDPNPDHKCVYGTAGEVRRG